jgi:hypothetical protein
MTLPESEAAIAAVAGEALYCLDNHRQTATFTSFRSPLTLQDAYRVTPRLRAAFEARGE